MVTRQGVPLIETSFTLTTNHKSDRDFYGSKARKFHTFQLDSEAKWSFRMLGIVLNEFSLCPGEYRDCTNVEKYHYFSFTDENDFDIKLLVHIFADLSIEVKVSTEFLLMHCTTVHEEIITSIGSQGRPLKSPQKRTLCKKQVTLSPKKDCSLAILNSLPMMFYSKYTFSKAFRWFAKRLTEIHLITKDDPDTSYILDYARNWINKYIDAQHINSLEAFMKSTIGFRWKYIYDD